MGYSYNELKEEVKTRNYQLVDYYKNFFGLFEEFYDSEEIKFMYIKNIFKDEKTTIFVFEDKIVSVTKDGIHYLFEENRGEIISKIIKAHKENSRDTQLNVIFDNGKEIILNNKMDSNDDWADEYGEDIKKLYKLL